MAEVETLKDVLRTLSLDNLIETFEKEKITLNEVQYLSEKDLNRLGLCTIGDRARFREACRKKQQRTPSHYNNSNSQQSSSLLSSSSSSLFHINERRALFTGKASKKHRKKPYNAKNHPWTANFFCLANRFATRVPTSQEKLILTKAGLGHKRIKLDLSNDEQEVFSKLTSEDGFPKLKEAGGFELLRCVANCRDLELMNCAMSAQAMKEYIGGGQSKIYLRPVQHTLSTMPLHSSEKNESTLMQRCKICNTEILLSSLRAHLRSCASFDSDDDNDEIFEYPAFFRDGSQQNIDDMEKPDVSENNDSNENNQSPEITNTGSSIDNNNLAPIINTSNDTSTVVTISDDDGIENFNNVIENFILNNKTIQNPVELLHNMQLNFVTGRALEISNPNEVLTGDTNFIMVDRNNILQSVMEEFEGLVNKRLTLEIQFYGEEAQDFGGPRKEFFLLALRKIKEEYFDGGLKIFKKEDYAIVGLIIGLSILQNGKFPTFLGEDMLCKIFANDSDDPCIQGLQQGLGQVGVYQVAREIPIFLHLFRPNEQSPVTKKRLVTLLKADFSEEGTNERMLQNAVYGKFIKYVQEAGAGRRGAVSLGHILKFVTGSDEEPVLGYELHPSLVFVEAMGHGRFTPTARTCINQLILPRATLNIPIPEDKTLFNLYDFAFTNDYFGQM